MTFLRVWFRVSGFAFRVFFLALWMRLTRNPKRRWVCPSNSLQSNKRETRNCRETETLSPHWFLLRGILFVVLAGCNDSAPPSPPVVSSSQCVDPVCFTDITESAGLAAFNHNNGGFGEKWFPEIMGSGGGFMDYNGDDWIDIVLVGGGSLPSRPPDSSPALDTWQPRDSSALH